MRLFFYDILAYLNTECVLVLRKVLETLDSGALCTAVHLIKTCKVLNNRAIPHLKETGPE